VGGNFMKTLPAQPDAFDGGKPRACIPEENLLFGMFD